ncbi:glycoprotease family-domain-containing protein [Biscogniauxia mediterranea]|nr:glycoprotease family-domain-containing protein [Biscogniauxia mediterranea]
MSRAWLSLASRPCAAATYSSSPRLCRPLYYHHHHYLLTSTISKSLTTCTSTRTRGSLLTLAIETSCDDTCVAVLERLPSGAARLHFNRKVTSDHRAFGGVHPLTAVLSHTAHLAPLVQEAFRALPRESNDSNDRTLWVDGVARARPDFVSVTRGPGMSSNLATGLNTAKGMAIAWDVPLLAVNHMQAHALTPRLVSALAKTRKGAEDRRTTEGKRGDEKVIADEPSPTFPFLSLLVSGGHTMLVRSRALTDHAILADAENIAIGDMLDKCARMIVPAEMLHGGPSTTSNPTISTMYGPILEEFAFPSAVGDDNYDYGYTPPATRVDEIKPFESSHGWTLTPPLAEMGRAMAFEFSGINGQVQAILHDRNNAVPLDERRLLARETMRIVFEHLATRILFALDGTGRPAKLRPRRGGRAARGTKSEVAENKGTGQDITTTTTTTMITEIKTENEQKEAEEAREPATVDDDEAEPPIRTVVLAGGVASNRYLRHVVRSLLDARGYANVALECPPPALCTDNAAMVGWAGLEMYAAGWRSALDVVAIRKWGLDPRGKDGGILGIGGWVRG